MMPSNTKYNANAVSKSRQSMAANPLAPVLRCAANGGDGDDGGARQLPAGAAGFDSRK